MKLISSNKNRLLCIGLVLLVWSQDLLGDEINRKNPIIVCDFNPTIETILEITTLFNSCCNQLQQDFSETFTTLNDIKNTLTTCCTLAQSEFDATFTALADLKNTLSACCFETTLEFQGTWTILAAAFNGTFTATADIKNTLTSCCNIIQNDFQATLSVISSLSSICLFACSAIPITAPTTISTPGYYCLAADGAGPIIINANNVTLDLNNHTLAGSGIGSGSGIIVNSGNNRIIKNGKIRNFDTAILCNSNINTLINTLEIDTCFVQAIEIISSTATYLNRLLISNITGIGVQFSGSNNHANILTKVTVIEAQQGFVLTSFFTGLLQECEVIDCISSIIPGTTLNGFVINEGNSNLFDTCSVKNFASSRSRGFAFNNASTIILRNCSVQNLVTSPILSNEVIGFDCTASSTDIQLWSCSLHDAQSSSVCTGYEFAGNTITAKNCLAQACTSLGVNAGTGFDLTGINISLINCQALSNTQNGFNAVTNNPGLMQYCQAGFNANNGFIIGANTTTGNCSSFNNNIGFNAPSNAIIYNCFASKNSTNYVATVPNTENANTQVNKAAPGLTGPFAGGNVFM